MTVEATASAETKPDGGASLLTDVLDAEAKNAHIRRVMSSSEDMTWATPQEWFDYLNLNSASRSTRAAGLKQRSANATTRQKRMALPKAGKTNGCLWNPTARTWASG